jgi:hypothetical protein
MRINFSQLPKIKFAGEETLGGGIAYRSGHRGVSLHGAVDFRTMSPDAVNMLMADAQQRSQQPRTSIVSSWLKGLGRFLPKR